MRATFFAGCASADEQSALSAAQSAKKKVLLLTPDH
jgi:hypothetical protein